MLAHHVLPPRWIGMLLGLLLCSSKAAPKASRTLSSGFLSCRTKCHSTLGHPVGWVGGTQPFPFPNRPFGFGSCCQLPT